MKYLYYKSHKGNFGDDLNEWLWPKMFGQEDLSDNKVFLGIGSILYNDFPLIKSLTNENKIVFGSGIRPTYNTFKIDSSWDVKFLRGPLSAQYLNNKYEYVADAAYALRSLDVFNDFITREKKYEISLMPYFKSVNFYNWQKICDDLGYHYINPESDKGIEYTLNEIASSKYIITEAMHGAILADIFRVPWNRFVLSTPVTEGQMVSEFKWMDWLYSVNLGAIETTYIKMYNKNKINNVISKITDNRLKTEFFNKSKVYDTLMSKLSNVNEFCLSKQECIKIIVERMHSHIIKLQKEIFI